jgi:hypothetical protein
MAFDVVLHDAHGGHDNDDGEDADEDAEQRESGAQFVGSEGAHGHEEGFAEFGG